jgi:hypothetical protein
MKVLEVLFEGIDFLVEKIPLAGSMKKKLDEACPNRNLTVQELTSEKWVKRLCLYLNKIFKKRMKKRPYDLIKLKEWISGNPECFTVFVRRKTISWPINGEKIVATVKIQPLKTDIIVNPPQNFDPFNITTADIASDFKVAKAVWVGDLTSSKQELVFLFLLIKNKVEFLKIPVYFRTENDHLRSILFERYGARVLKPDGSNADGNTILVIP